jgi:hypothetical protein
VTMKEMATGKEMYELLGRALSDKEFRVLLMEDPMRAARSCGYNLTEEQLAKLWVADWSHLAEELDTRLSKRLR